MGNALFYFSAGYGLIACLLLAAFIGLGVVGFVSAIPAASREIFGYVKEMFTFKRRVKHEG